MFKRWRNRNRSLCRSTFCLHSCLSRDEAKNQRFLLKMGDGEYAVAH